MLVRNFVVPLVEDGEPATASTFNNPYLYIQDALNLLSQDIGGLGNKSAVLQYDAPLSEDATPGTLVYYEKGSAVFRPALAQLRATPGSQGQSVEADTSRVAGMVVAVDGGVGTLLIGGYYENGAMADACLGVGALPGVYFLSPTDAGKATLDPGWNMRQPSLSYFGDGKFSLPLFYLAHDNHHHADVALKDYWVPVDSGVGDITIGGKTVSVPAGASFYYDAASDSDMATAGEIADNVTAVFYGGILQTALMGTFIISEGVLWSTLATAPVSGSVVLFNFFPFAYGDSVVRSVTSLSSRITAIAKNGSVYLDAGSFTNAGQRITGKAVSEIDGDNVYTTPVVTGAAAGPGINLARTSSGAIIVSSSGMLGSAVDATIFDMNGAQRSITGKYAYMVFPSGRDSGLTMHMPLEGAASDLSMKACIWGTALSGTGTVNAVLYFTPLGGVSDPVDVPADGVQSNLSLSAMSAGKMNYRESSNFIEFQGPGLLTAVLSASSPSTSIQFQRLGFKVFATNSSSINQGSSGSKVEAVTNSDLTAGEQIAKYNVLKIVQGQLYVCKASDASSADTAVGIALESAEQGQAVEYMLAGTIEASDIAVSSGLPLFVGIDGTLTQDAQPTAAFIQRIGMGLTSTSFQINIQTAVLQ